MIVITFEMGSVGVNSFEVGVNSLEVELFSVVTVIDAVSAAILPVWVDFTSLKGLPCAPGPATTRRGMLVTNG